MVGSINHYKIKEFGRTLGQNIIGYSAAVGAGAGLITGLLYEGLDQLTGYPMFNGVSALEAGLVVAGAVTTAGLAIQSVREAYKGGIHSKNALMHFTVNPSESAGDLNETLEGIVKDVKADKGWMKEITKHSATNGLATGADYTEAFKNFTQDMLAVYASEIVMPLTGQAKDKSGQPLWAVEDTSVTPSVMKPKPNTSGMGYKVEVGVKKGEPNIAYVRAWTKKDNGLLFSDEVVYRKFELAADGTFALLDQVV